MIEFIGLNWYTIDKATMDPFCEGCLLYRSNNTMYQALDLCDNAEKKISESDGLTTFGYFKIQIVDAVKKSWLICVMAFIKDERNPFSD